MINEDKPLGDGHLDFRLEIKVPASVVGEDTKFAIRELVEGEWFGSGPSLSTIEIILEDIMDAMKRKVISSLMERISAERNGPQ